MNQVKQLELTLLGQNIRRIRKSKGFNQTELASKANTRTATISELENGNNPNPGWDLIERVAEVLNTSIHQLTQQDAGVLSETKSTELAVGVRELIQRQDELLAANEPRITLNEAKWLSSLPLKNNTNLSAEEYVSILRQARITAGCNLSH